MWSSWWPLATETCRVFINALSLKHSCIRWYLYDSLISIHNTFPLCSFQYFALFPSRSSKRPLSKMPHPFTKILHAFLASIIQSSCNNHKKLMTCIIYELQVQVPSSEIQGKQLSKPTKYFFQDMYVMLSWSKHFTYIIQKYMQTSVTVWSQLFWWLHYIAVMICSANCGLVYSTRHQRWYSLTKKS
jgi:hypothetical protein